MYLALLLFEDELIHIVAISFTSLIFTELIMVALTVRTWHIIIVLAELLSLSLYGLSMVLLRDLFGELYFLLVKNYVFLYKYVFFKFLVLCILTMYVFFCKIYVFFSCKNLLFKFQVSFINLLQIFTSTFYIIYFL